MLSEFNLNNPKRGILFLRYLVRTLFVGLNAQAFGKFIFKPRQAENLITFSSDVIPN